MGSYRLLEHTADMGIEALADTPEELFAEAAYGLKDIIAGDCDGLLRLEQVVEVEGGDRGELLVNWLNEILYLLEVQKIFPVDFEVEEVGEQKLKARVSGEFFDPKRHRVEREVKAVTYHRLSVEQNDGQWAATVYVDL